MQLVPQRPPYRRAPLPPFGVILLMITSFIMREIGGTKEE